MSDCIIRAENISFAYPGGENLFSGLDLSVRPGEFTGIIGPNGAGKSTILKIMSGFLKTESGAVLLNGVPVHSYSPRERAELIAAVPQRTPGDMPFTVREVVTMGRISKKSRFSMMSEEDIDAVNTAMSETDIIHLAGKKYSQLSGGEQQRVRLASAIAQRPRILFLDEPTSQLDIGHAVNFMKLVKTLNESYGITVLTVSHDIQLMLRFLSRIILVKNGAVMADGSPENVITSENLSSAYGCRIEVTGSMHVLPVI
jgi:iron complex transport system ATP-binding protein